MSPVAHRPRRRLILEGVVVAQLWCAAAGLELVLSRVPLPTIVRWASGAAATPLRRLPAGRRCLPEERVEQLGFRVSRYWRGSRACLPRALLISWLAATRNGSRRRTSVVIGVRLDSRMPFTAHAWVEVDGRIHAERVDPRSRMQPIATFPLSPDRGTP